MIHLRLDSSAPQSLAAMANASLQIPKGVRDEALQLLKNKSHEFVKEHFMAPDKKRMIIWLKKKMPEEYWSEVKYLVKRFRKSMPIVSHRKPDGQRTTEGKKGLARTFAAPSWVSADLGALSANYDRF